MSENMSQDVLPLFVLPMVLMPGEIQELRIFEPRYRQMLDSCILDEKPFGLVMSDSFNQMNGWDCPVEIGTEADILQHETKGANHFITIVGRRRFVIKRIIEPALPPLTDDSFSDIYEEDGPYPELETILKYIPDTAENSNLYFSGEVEYIETEKPIDENHQFFVAQLLRTRLLAIAQMIGLPQEMLDDWVEEKIGQIVNEDYDSIYSVAALFIAGNEQRQSILEITSPDEVLENLVSLFYDEEE
ncbi:MAG: Uncharacterised protein [Methanobacteriota archaeon]|jgi:Lon protease-like protein|nr:MAG: Uncharacterised protein [Euryarchaeota archaeon]